MSEIPFICPETRASLAFDQGTWRTPDGMRSYPVIDGIPCLVYPPELTGSDAGYMKFYDRFAPLYAASERYLGRALTGVDVLEARRVVAGMLPIGAGEAVLEVSPGPGVFQGLLAERVGPDGSLTALDLSQGMLLQCRHNTRDQKPAPTLVRGNASYLPFAAGSVDGLFHFGGVNLFTEPEKALAEFARVVKPGGWVAFGDEHFSPEWAARTDWRAKLLQRMNPGYTVRVPSQPAALRCLGEHVVFGGLAYLRVCRVDS